ncbi:MAG TPA: hypothetical protein ENF82_03405 [Candidatus Methanomethylia archaeon]|nr:hypothetical protein [Candidatus Methanomethylicia archaeon]
MESESLGNTLRRELARKGVHCLGLSIPLAHILIGKVEALVICMALLSSSILFEWIRVREYPLFPFKRVEAYIARPRERAAIGAHVYLCASAIATIVLFPEKIAVAALTSMILGDAAAAIAGVSLGRRKSPLCEEKSVEGALAGALVAGVTVYMLMNPSYAVGTFILFLLLDLVELGVDDNLVFPVAIALQLWVFNLALGG